MGKHIISKAASKYRFWSFLTKYVKKLRSISKKKMKHQKAI